LPRIAVLTFLLFIPLEALSLQPEAQPTQKLLVLDVADDILDGPAFIQVLDAYVNDMGVTTEVSPVDSVPATYAQWIELAIDRGTREGAAASLWTEPAEGEVETLNVFLVVLSQQTEATIVLPVELGIKRGPKLYRSLAAATRMILDTNLLEDLGAVARVAEEEEPPDPWKPGTQNEPEKRPPVEHETARTLGVALLYTGDLGPKGTSYNQGLTADIRLYLFPELSFMVGGGALFSPKKTAAKIAARQLRFPILIGMGGHLTLGRFNLGMTLFWMVEAVRLAGLKWPEDVIDTGDFRSMLDTGGGAELSVGTRLVKNVSVLFGLAATGMVVSHRYRALGTDWFSSNPFRLWFRAGISLNEL